MHVLDLLLMWVSTPHQAQGFEVARLRRSLHRAAKGRGGGATKSAAAKKAAETRKRNAEAKTGGKAKSARYK